MRQNIERQTKNTNLYVPALDGLRGLAVLVVFLSHASLVGYNPLPWIQFSGIGKMGVFLFFILSSFLLTYPFLLKQEQAFSKYALVNFSYRRFFRIYPLFVVYLLLAMGSSMVLTTVAHKENVGIPFYLDGWEFIQHIFLQQGKGVTWSILVEFRYYFVLPLIAYVYGVLLRGAMLLSLVVTMVLIAIAQYILPQSEALVNDPRLLPYAPVMLMGTIIAVFQYNYNNKWQIKPWMRVAQEIIGWIACALLVLEIPMVWYTVMDGSSICATYNLDIAEFSRLECHKLFHHKFIENSVLWVVVLLGAVNGDRLLQKLFQSKALGYMGKISFSFYLWHPCVLSVLHNVHLPIPDTLSFWLALVITTGVSHISYKLIEIPSSKIQYQPR